MQKTFSAQIIFVTTNKDNDAKTLQRDTFSFFLSTSYPRESKHPLNSSKLSVPDWS